MNRRSRLVIGVLAIAGVACLGVYMTTQRRWATASQAEIDRILGPDLTKLDAPTPAEVRRGMSLRKALEEVDLTTSVAAVGPKKDRYPSSFAAEWLARNRDKLANVRRITEEGRYRHVASAFFPDENGGRMRARLSGVVRVLAAVGQSAPGDVAAQALVVGQLLTWRRSEASDALITLLLSLRDQATIDEATIACLEAGRLSTGQARELLRILRHSGSDSELLKRVLLREFQSSVYPLLADPEAFFRGVSKSRGMANGGEEDLPGNYDAKEAAAMAGDLMHEELRSVDSTYDRIESSVKSQITRKQGALPEDRSVGVAGWKHGWEHFIFRLRMARIPNSFAYDAVIFPKEMPTLLEAYWRSRVVHTLTLVELAAFVFNEERGRVPNSLEELRSAGLIDAVPSDPFSHGPLRLDSSNRKVWSVGPDHRDDGGTGDLFGRAGQDVVARLPQAAK